MINLVNKLSVFYKIVFVTARGEEGRIKTEQWLKRYIRLEKLEVYMRPANDNATPDHEIKENIINELNLTPDDVDFVLDDRLEVVEMWTNNGFLCLRPNCMDIY